MGKGIEKCKIDVHLKGIDVRFVKKGEVIVIYPGFSATFFLDEDCLGNETVNKQATINKAKWAYIYKAYYNVSKTGDNEKPFGLWADIGNNKPFIEAKGIGNQYKVGSSLELKPQGTSFYYGCLQRVEVFSNEPDKGFYFFVIPLAEPHISFVKFENKVYNYEDLISFQLCLHEIPSNLSYTETKYRAKIYVVDFNNAINYGDKTPSSELEKLNVLDEPLESDIPNKPFNRENPQTPNVNTYLNFSNLKIDESWRHKTDHTSGEFEYTVVVEIYEEGKEERVFVRNFAFSPTDNLQQFDAKLLDVKDITIPQSGKFSSFLVDYDTAFMKMQKLEITKSNKIQYIGDVDYTIKEYDPCHYEIIEIHEKDKSPVEIFNENTLSSGGDRTEKFYDTVLGDVSNKEIKIIAKNLKTKNGCQGILLEKGQKHTDIHNVFPMRNILSAYKKNITIFENNTDIQKQNTNKVDATYFDKKTPIDKNNSQQVLTPKEKDNNYEGGKYEYEKDNSQTSPSQDYDLKSVSKVHYKFTHNWEENTDYSLDNTGIFTIKKLNYKFIKTYDTELARYLGYDDRSVLDDMIDKLWAFRYFFLSKEFSQIYFVPVSSCRYPNQLAKIRVFPDIKWEVFILIVPADSLAYGAGNIEYSPQKSEHESKEQKAYKSSNSNLVDYKVEMHIKSTIKGEVTDLSIGLEQKIGKYLGAIAKIKTMLDFLSHKNKVIEGAGAKAQAMVAKVGNKGFSPFFVDFSLPSLHVGGSWKYDIPKGEKDAAVIGSVDIAFRPLLKAKGGIDLIAAMHYIPVVGEVIIAIEVIKDLTEMTITAFTPLDVSSKIWFNLYAFGQVDLKLSVDFFNAYNTTLEPKVTLGVGLELGVKIEAYVKKVVFTDGKGDRETVGGIGGEFSGKGETGLELKAKTGVNTENYIFVEGSVSFIGITLEVVGKLEITKRKDKKSKAPTPKGKFQVVERKDDFEKFKWTLK